MTEIQINNLANPKKQPTVGDAERGDFVKLFGSDDMWIILAPFKDGNSATAFLSKERNNKIGAIKIAAVQS